MSITPDKWETSTLCGVIRNRSTATRMANRWEQFTGWEYTHLPTYIIDEHPEGGYLVMGPGFHTPLPVTSITKARRICDQMGKELITAGTYTPVITRKKQP